MEKVNNIRVEMIRMEGDVAPFVQVDCMDKEAQEYSGLMLVDSGSTTNILSPEIAEQTGLMCKLDEEDTISSISKEVMRVSQVRFSFVLGTQQFSETFCISNQQLPISVKGMKVLGILGNQFLQKHRLVLDYSDYTLHTSNVSPSNLSIEDCSFFFPMDIGLQFYGLPVLSVKQNGKELVTLVDTGSTTNMISRQTLTENEFKHRRLEGKDVIVNVIGEVEVDEARVWFNMMSLYKDDVCELIRHDKFSVLPCNIMTPEIGDCDTNGDQLPPIEVLLGSPFIARERWILDFGANIIYKRKAA